MMDKSKLPGCVLLGFALLCCVNAQFQPTHKATVCPPGFTLYGPSSKCYALINTKTNKDWHVAQCSRLAVGAFIAAPLDAGEDKFIQGLIQGQSTTERQRCVQDTDVGVYGEYYLGAESCERKMCNTFQWHLSGGFRQAMEYTNFQTGEPNCQGGKEYCINYHLNLGWNDVSCERSLCSICEFRLQK